jgi:hypothetical protein
LAAESAQHNRTIRKLIAFHNQGKKIGKEPCHQEIRAEQRWNRAKLPGNPGGMTMEQSRWNGKQDSTEVQTGEQGHAHHSRHEETSEQGIAHLL